MAEMIRQEEDLLAVRIRLRPGRAGAQILLTGYRAKSPSRKYKSTQTPYIKEGLTPEAYRYAQSSLTPDCGTVVGDFVREQLRPGEALGIRDRRRSTSRTEGPRCGGHNVVSRCVTMSGASQDRTGDLLLAKRSPLDPNHGKKSSKPLLDSTICRSCRFGLPEAAGPEKRE